tara:strand:- start:166 stop:588 length:423 start_codon:yes stop_codon:yes gene_type:complete
MAINKDSGDTRTYAANTTTSFNWRIPQQSSPQTSSISSTRLNWPGKIGYASPEANVNVFVYACTFVSDDAAVIQASSDNFSSHTNNYSNGHARNENYDHAQIPGMHFAAVNINSEPDGTVYLRAHHATSTSAVQQKTKIS